MQEAISYVFCQLLSHDKIIKFVIMLRLLRLGFEFWKLWDLFVDFGSKKHISNVFSVAVIGTIKYWDIDYLF